MPEVPGPAEGLTFAQLMELGSGDKRSATESAKEWAALDTRYLGNSAYPGQTHLADDVERPARAQLWVRINGELGDDPSLHAAAFTYASDLTLLGASLVPHDVEIGSPRLLLASLDHTIWFHRPFRADRWWLYDQWSPSASASRGLSLARVFTEEGILVATVAQEGLIRQRTR
jgi:acyl-CoA thioesterase-2